MFALCYHRHGGSGLNFTYSEVMGMGIEEVEWYRERLDEAISRENRAIEAANRRGRR